MIEKIALFFKGISDYMKSDLCLFKYFKDSLVITNNNFVLISPLILFIMFLGIFLRFSTVNSFSTLVLVLLIFFALSSVFFSGWTYTVMLAVKAKQGEEDAFAVLKQFPTGVGKYFLQYFLMLIIFSLLFTLVIIFTYRSAHFLIGSFGISRPDLFLAMSSPETMTQLIKSLTVEQQIKLSQWNLYFIFTTTVYSFLVMFWIPEIIFKDDSVLNAFVSSLGKIFKKFFKSLTIFAFLTLVYFVISLLTALAGNHILEFIITVLYFYYMLYAVVLVFLFYKREFCDNE